MSNPEASTCQTVDRQINHFGWLVQNTCSDVNQVSGKALAAGTLGRRHPRLAPCGSTMKGRGSRVINPDQLRSVTPNAHQVIDEAEQLNRMMRAHFQKRSRIKPTMTANPYPKTTLNPNPLNLSS